MRDGQLASDAYMLATIPLIAHRREDIGVVALKEDSL